MHTLKLHNCQQNDEMQLSEVMHHVVHHHFETTWMRLQPHKHISLRTENKERIQLLNIRLSTFFRTSRTQIISWLEH